MSAQVPIAIIGIGCKFPGGCDNKDLYYEFLRNKGDGMVSPPPDRWIHEEWYGGRDEPGKYHTTKLGFINGIDQFDALEFSISAKEGAHLDPAIRLSLEVAQEALQDSGIDYRGSNTGVFFGNMLTTVDEIDEDRYEIDNYNGIGRCISIRANRISFTFDLRGPSLTVDTACSASATAMHLALCSIKLGEINQALVIGANTIINPEHTISISKFGVLSPTGSSKSFDASADGYARAEGVAAVLIKRLDLALNDGDSIYSVIKGSAINSNGKGKSLPMPEGDMQAETIKTAYRVAQRDPSDAFFVELHATGTQVGDPIETNAAGKVFSRGRDAGRVLRIGSVKANIGHTEGCSFLASLIKVSLMLRRKEILPNIRFDKANPKIDFSALKMRVQTELESINADMAASDGTFVASISSYGVGGSNVHVVLEMLNMGGDLSEPVVMPVDQKNPLYLFVVGCMTEPTIARWKDALVSAYDKQKDDRMLRSVARNLARQTRAYPNRAFAIGSSLDASIKFSKSVSRNNHESPKLCLVFSGQGPQHVFMGRELAETYPVFLSAIQENDRILVETYGQESMLERTGLFVLGVECKLAANGMWPVQEVVLSLVFLHIALVDLVRSLGIQYDFVIGHSIGEIAMGYASGHYDREMAIGVALARVASMKRAEGNGAMVALSVGVQDAKAIIRKVLSQAKETSGLWIAGIHSPQAVTVAGSHALIDALVELANDPDSKVFSRRLRVTCAFHTPLMQSQEELFKQRVAATPLSQGTKTPFAKVMSTTDGRWLDRDLDIEYCWDNISRPVLFGTAISKIISDQGPDGVRFLEIGPHPVLKTYIEQCGGESVSLIRRPNSKFPMQNTGEQYQLLEGIGNLLAVGFKNVDFDRLFASPDGVKDFMRATLPEYAYNKSYSWVESGAMRSQRLRECPRPLASSRFRVSANTHPGLTGKVVLDALPVFPTSGYVESVLENGAMVVSNVAIHPKPFVMNGGGEVPGHAGCVINGDRWEFRAATTPYYHDNGVIVLDAIYASGTFSRINPAYDENVPRVFDFQAKLARSLGVVTGDEFYAAIPSAYHFKNYLKFIHEIDDERSWGTKAYLSYLEIPLDILDVFGKGYVIHPGILDSITQSGLAMFIDMGTKQFDFNGIYFPVKIDALRRWDSRNAPNLDEEIKKGIWTYFTCTTWAPTGPFKSNYVVANSEGKVLLTIEGFEFVRAYDLEPIAITDSSREERLTTVWQPKSFPAAFDVLCEQTSMRSALEVLVRDAAAAGARVVRVADVAKTKEIAVHLDDTLEVLKDDAGVVVEYFCVTNEPSGADAKASSLRYSRARSLVLDSWQLGDDTAGTPLLSSFDVVVHHVDLSAVQMDVVSIANLVGRNGVILIYVTDSGTRVEDTGMESLTLRSLYETFSSVAGCVVQVSDFVDGKALLCAKITQSMITVPSGPSKTVIVQSFVHGKEGDLIEIAKNISSEAELWITGNDDAAGIGALGVASCIIAEFPMYKVFSVLFEDHMLDDAAREGIVHKLRKNILLLEQHMKISRDGEVLVRRLVHGSADMKQIAAPAAGLTTSGSLVAYFPPALGAFDVEIKVNALGVVSAKPVFAFSGLVKSLGTSVANLKVGDKVLGIACQTLADDVVVSEDTVVVLPKGVNATDAVALVTFLPAWMGLVLRASISASSTVLVHDGASAAGSAVLQVAKRLGAKVLCTVSNREAREVLSNDLGIPISHVVHVEDLSFAMEELTSNGTLSQFDVIFNSSGKNAFARGTQYLSPFGTYIHVKSADVPEIPAGVESLNILDIDRYVSISPASLVPAISALLSIHALEPFEFRPRIIPMSSYKAASDDLDSLVIVPDVGPEVKIDPTIQLFDPRKAYVLVGGCSELGVRIIDWMANRGARRVFLTSRRGLGGLTRTDDIYVRSVRARGVQVEVIAADALDQQKMSAIFARANEAGPIGGIFVMTVVLRDGRFTNLTQESFDDVYQSKVAVFNTILRCIDPSTMDFILLFSTIGSVFGYGGQATYCASQLYLDRIADTTPNTISMSFPPITDSGIFKRIVVATKGKANTAQLGKMGVTTAQMCNFIGDAIVRKIAHYVPMLAINNVPETFPACEPLLYCHLLPKRYLSSGGSGDNKGDNPDSPASLLAALLSMDVEQVSDNAVISSFGLDSLGATQYSTQLKSCLGLQVNQIDLLGPMTISSLNRMLAKVDPSAGSKNNLAASNGTAEYGHALVPILNSRLAYDEPYTTEASPHQYRIWLDHCERDNSGRHSVPKIGNMTYTGAIRYDTHGGCLVTISTDIPIDTDRMLEAVAEVVRRHGALRTRFTWNNELGKLEQTVYPDVDFKVTLVDLSGEPDPATKAYEMSVTLNKKSDFNLDRLPLLIFTMFDLGGNSWAFNIVVHHIIIDGASLGIFFYEMFKLYLEGPGSLPEVAIHYSDFSDWLIKTFERRAELREQHLRFWFEKLNVTQSLHLTLTTPSDLGELSSVTQIEARISGHPLEQYLKLITSVAATPFAGFFAAYNVLLHKYSGQSTFVIGTPVAQRNIPMLTSVMGCFAHMLPIKATVDEMQSFAEYLQQFKASLAEYLAHDEVTYEDLVGVGNLGHGYVKHVFAPAYINESISQVGSNHITTKSVTYLTSGENRYESLFSIHPSNGHVVFRFDNHMFTEEAAWKFLRAYFSLVEMLGKNPERKIRDISVVSLRQ